VCPAEDGVVFPGGRVSMGGGRLWPVAALDQGGLGVVSEEAV
jgi:hypothetical protein